MIIEASIFLSKMKRKIFRRQSPEQLRLDLKNRALFAKKANYKEVKHAV